MYKIDTTARYIKHTSIFLYRRYDDTHVKIIPRLSVRILPHLFRTRYRLASWTKSHKHFGNIIRRIAFSEDDMIVLPKDSVVRDISVDISVDSAGDRTVLPSDIVKEVIRGSDHIFIMNFCLCRKSNRCDDYPVDHGCIFMGKGTERIPKEFGRMATPDEAIAYIDECSELGLVHIIGRNKLDSLWLSTGNKKDLMTICNCCPCCCLWNMVRDISDNIAECYKRMDSVEVSANPERCIGCGMCSDICFTKAINIVGGRCSISDSMCRGCGRCAEVCPNDAITLTYDRSIVSSEVERIRSLVDLK